MKITEFIGEVKIRNVQLINDSMKVFGIYGDRVFFDERGA